ncbi:hypothetical protein GBA52_000521 [Prunus armeniaca]|nr:hypothetical protein GBA52_000521 [Prunus armeniaca]
MEVTDGDTVDPIYKLFRKLGRNPNTKELFGLRLRRIRQRTTYKVRKTTLKLATIPVHFKMSRKLKEIRENLEDLTKQMSCFQFKQYGFSKIRHASVVSNPSSCLIPKALCKAKKLRTLNLLSPREDSEQVLPAVVSTFKHLRVLNLSGYDTKRLHRSIGGLIYLRYLDLSYTLIETMPATICDLCNLQTLNLSNCSELRELPRGTARLIRLRHLHIDNCAQLYYMPPSIGNLCQLRTLPVFIVGGKIEDDITQLLRLSNLQGKLKITHLERVRRLYDELLDISSWMSLRNFYSLELLWGNVDEGKSASNTSSRQSPRRHPLADLDADLEVCESEGNPLRPRHKILSFEELAGCT